MNLIVLPLLFVLMWFLLIRPQQQRVRKRQEIIASVGVGDEIVTAGGILGTVTAADAAYLRVEVAPGVELRLVRNAVSDRLTPGSALGAGDTGAGPSDAVPPDVVDPGDDR